MHSKICLLILNYNGKEHLDACLSSALKAADAYGAACPVIVVDNQSTDDDVAYIQSNFPKVEVIISGKNDCLFSLNKVVRERSEEIVVILNNDMRFDENFIKPLMEHFVDAEVFAVTAKTMNWDGSSQWTSKRRGYYKNFWFYKEWDDSPLTASYTLDFCGGASAVRRHMFVELGGFNDLYKPGYWEDTDLSWQGWRSGWKIIYEPKSVAYHHASSTFNKIYGKQKVEWLIRRNEVLFTVKNCGDTLFLLVYLLLLPARAVRNYLSGNKSMALGFISALSKIHTAIFMRFSGTSRGSLKDRDFLKIIENSDGI